MSTHVVVPLFDLQIHSDTTNLFHDVCRCFSAIHDLDIDPCARFPLVISCGPRQIARLHSISTKKQV